jgi:cytochrome c-type biogenesis protein CcmH
VRRVAGARLVLLVAAAALSLAIPAVAAAQCPKTTLGDIEDEVMCPVCGTPLSLATEAPQAQRQRELIQSLIADCRSKDEIKRVLVAEFGDEVLALPEDEGFDLAAYLVPALAILLAAGAVGFAAVRWRRNRAEPRGAARPAGASDARLDEDMDRYEL